MKKQRTFIGYGFVLSESHCLELCPSFWEVANRKDNSVIRLKYSDTSEDDVFFGTELDEKTLNQGVFSYKCRNNWVFPGQLSYRLIFQCYGELPSCLTPKIIIRTVIV